MHRFFTYCILLFLSTSVFAQGNLLITPMRVIFDGQKRMEELNLANTGHDTARYLISLIEIRMNTNGSFETINTPDSGQLFASSYLRIFPRNVTLPPGEAQLVKVQLIKTGQLKEGEYRSHIYLRAVPNPAIQGEIPVQTDSAQISVKLIPVFGISIPVIIRTGTASAKITMSDVSLDVKDSLPPRLNMVLNRSGNNSVYGDITVDYVSAKGKVTKVGSVRGLAVYTPTPQRQLRMELERVAGIDYHTGKLKIAYAADSKNVLAQTELLLQ